MSTTNQILIEFKKLKKQLKQPLQVTKTVLRARHEAKSAFLNPNTPPIIIYQMGKVGSSTIYNSLIHTSLANPVLHLHFLSPDLAKHRKFHKQRGIYPFPYHLYLGEATRKVIGKHRNFPIKIISFVRDPIAFHISNLFQNPNFAEKSVVNDAGFIDAYKATEYLENSLKNPDAFSYVFEWFDRELKTVFDIDVFADKFPVETGYFVYSKNNVEALVIRLEDLSEKGPKAISDFLDLDNLLIFKNQNMRDKLVGKESYKQVLEKISISPYLCNQIYSSQFVKHFYSKDMIEKFTSKWTFVELL